jgi:hypothetical protein
VANEIRNPVLIIIDCFPETDPHAQQAGGYKYDFKSHLWLEYMIGLVNNNSCITPAFAICASAGSLGIA